MVSMEQHKTIGEACLGEVADESCGTYMEN